ncbi:MAG: NAD-dependent epimerase/dehydratase family protein [Capsulimonadaceae bacterium]|nr:NAD-dependent epimerase/dehydratase family protein [Capsulimonadaceae bacterium]
MTDESFSFKVMRLQGPILVLGASGFIGANLLRTLLKHRPDVIGTSSHIPTWRLTGLPAENVRAVDLLVESNLEELLNTVKPRTVFNCVAYGAYSFQTDVSLIYQTNFNLTERIVRKLYERGVSAYVHAGSSSEYGDAAAGPLESDEPLPNSDYAVSKVACANLLRYYGRRFGFPGMNLRLYSIYGPLEDASRLVPAVVRKGLQGEYPDFVNPKISRDFVYVDDCCEAFVDAALAMRREIYGESFNIGTGKKTSIADVADVAKDVFGIDSEPTFTMPARDWDVSDWYANSERAARELGWTPHVELREGLKLTAVWYSSLPDVDAYMHASKRFALDTRHSVSAIIACYKDGQAIPIMYDRLKKTFDKLKVEYEIVFVNDNSPDDSEEVIRAITRDDPRVIGVSHSRNFGSQSAFKSGMEISTKNACVLMDGDLQDPPELIESFVEKWREGYDVVYGRRVKRVAPFAMQVAYKVFYRLFDRFSYISIPHDAGDFSLMDRRVVDAVLQFPERDLFLRGVRAFVGYKQTGVDYVRPERMFGRTTNNLARNIEWAKKGILSFSNAPLMMLSFFGTILLGISLVLGLVQIIFRLLYPHLSPKGVTTELLFILFFGSINMFAVGVLAEYVAKIFEEVKRRPHFIRKSIIRDGEVRPSAERSGQDAG